MNLLFAEEMVRQKVAQPASMELARLNGQQVEIESAAGKITAYIWNGAVYVAEISVRPEAMPA